MVFRGEDGSGLSIIIVKQFYDQFEVYGNDDCVDLYFCEK